MNTTVNFFKYHGTGNDFIMIDNRDLSFPKTDQALVKFYCDRRFGIGADGLILIESDTESDFKMVYYNSDGNQSSMCGNGGRCIVAFAKQLGIIGDSCRFQAVDGFHNASIDSRQMISLQMADVALITREAEATFLNTGSPHHVLMVTDLQHFDVYGQGKKIRESTAYQPEGTNVNFVEKMADDTFAIRTFERGVEDETWSCGTGATAVAIAMFDNGQTQSNQISIQVKGGRLTVDFVKGDGVYHSVFLTGPAQRVFHGIITLDL